MAVEPGLLERANWWFDVSWYGLLGSGVITAIAAVSTVAFLFVQFWSSSVRDKQSEWRTSTIELEASKAKADAAKANENAAVANESAKALELKTERMRSENLALESSLEKERAARVAMIDQIKPRDMTREQMTKIADVIRGHVGTVYLYPLADPEASRYMFAISESLRAGGADPKLKLVLDEKTGLPTFPDKFEAPVSIVGVTVFEAPSTGDSGFVGTMVRAFSNAGISVIGQSMDAPPPGVETPAIFVGLKPAPFLQFPEYAMPPELERHVNENPPPWNPK